MMKKGRESMEKKTIALKKNKWNMQETPRENRG